MPDHHGSITQSAPGISHSVVKIAWCPLRYRRSLFKKRFSFFCGRNRSRLQRALLIIILTRRRSDLYDCKWERLVIGRLASTNEVVQNSNKSKGETELRVRLEQPVIGSHRYGDWLVIYNYDLQLTFIKVSDSMTEERVFFKESPWKN